MPWRPGMGVTSARPLSEARGVLAMYVAIES
jgi:hypothetical protein